MENSVTPKLKTRCYRLAQRCELLNLGETDIWNSVAPKRWLRPDGQTRWHRYSNSAIPILCILVTECWSSKLGSTDAVSVAPIWWEWLGFRLRFKLDGSDVEMLVTPNLWMWNLTEWICGKNDWVFWWLTFSTLSNQFILLPHPLLIVLAFLWTQTSFIKNIKWRVF